MVYTFDQIKKAIDKKGYILSTNIQSIQHKHPFADIKIGDILMRRIMDIFNENGYVLPHLSHIDWNNELRKLLYTLEYIESPAETFNKNEKFVLVGIRVGLPFKSIFKDILCVFNMSNNIFYYFPCNLDPNFLPNPQFSHFMYDKQVTLAPGYYKELFTIDSYQNLIQYSPVSLFEPIIKNDLIINYIKIETGMYGINVCANKEKQENLLWPTLSGVVLQELEDFNILINTIKQSIFPIDYILLEERDIYEEE